MTVVPGLITCCMFFWCSHVCMYFRCQVVVLLGSAMLRWLSSSLCVVCDEQIRSLGSYRWRWVKELYVRTIYRVKYSVDFYLSCVHSWAQVCLFIVWTALSDAVIYKYNLIIWLHFNVGSSFQRFYSDLNLSLCDDFWSIAWCAQFHQVCAIKYVIFSRALSKFKM